MSHHSSHPGLFHPSGLRQKGICPLRRTAKAGFTLLELLTVMAIVAILTTVTLPALQSLYGAGNVRKAIGDFSGVLQEARTYALANHTYVRVAIAQISTPSAAHPTPTSIILLLSSCDGTLSAGSATPSLSDMADPAKWPAIEPPLILADMLIYNTINGDAPDTSQDSYPSQSSVGSMTRAVSGFPSGASGPVFSSFIQFNPAGELSVLQSVSSTSDPARHVKIAVDQPSTPTNASTPRLRNPFILRLSGVNGSIIVLREGQGI